MSHSLLPFFIPVVSKEGIKTLTSQARHMQEIQWQTDMSSQNSLHPNRTLLAQWVCQPSFSCVNTLWRVYGCPSDCSVKSCQKKRTCNKMIINCKWGGEDSKGLTRKLDDLAGGCQTGTGRYAPFGNGAPLDPAQEHSPILGRKKVCFIHQKKVKLVGVEQGHPCGRVAAQFLNTMDNDQRMAFVLCTHLRQRQCGEEHVFLLIRPSIEKVRFAEKRIFKRVGLFIIGPSDKLHPQLVTDLHLGRNDQASPVAKKIGCQDGDLPMPVGNTSVAVWCVAKCSSRRQSASTWCLKRGGLAKQNCLIVDRLLRNAWCSKTVGRGAARNIRMAATKV